MKKQNYNYFKNHFEKWFFLLEYLLFFLISFLSWNYYGLLFLINGYLLFKHLEHIKKDNIQVFFIKTFTLTFAWNLGAIGWLLTVDKGLYALLINSIIYTFPFLLMFILKEKTGLFLFIPIWLLFELSINIYSYITPLITIGNAMSNQIYLIQWYKYLNIIGGSFWLLIISYFIYKSKIIYSFLILVLPVIFSVSIFLKTEKNNIELKNKKYLIFNPQYCIKKEQKILPYLHKILKPYNNYDFLIIPEATIPFKLNSYKNTIEFKQIKKIVDKNKKLSILFGASIPYDKKTKINTAILLSKNKTMLKVKRKLIPFIENAPKIIRPFYDKPFYISNIKDDLVKIKENNNFTPFICYEIFFPFYISKATKKMKLAIVISSEQFLNNSFYGKKFYNNILKLRAIENNQMFLKSSSFNNSILINSRGIIINDSKNKEIYMFKIP